MWHKHKWKIIDKTYAEPVGTHGSYSFGPVVSKELLQRTLFGLTTVLWECEICHKLRREEMLGKLVENDKQEITQTISVPLFKESK